MEVIYLIIFFLNLFFGLFFSYFAFKFLNNERLKNLAFLVSLLAISFYVSALFYILWFFGFYDYSSFDFCLISSVVVFFRVCVLLFLFSRMLSNRNLLYFLLFYLSIIFSFFLGVGFCGVVFLVSFLILLLLSLILFSRKEFERIGFFGVFYSFLSCILFLLLFFGWLDVFYVVVALHVLFFFYLFEVISVTFYNSSILIKHNGQKASSSFILDFLKYFVFIVVLANFVFIATVSVHELGHYSTAHFLDCSSTKIVYESGLPHTEVLCQNDDFSNYLIAIFGGLLLPVIVSFFFFFSGGTFMKEIGLLIVGFNLIISYKDFLDLGLSPLFSLFVSVVGFLCVIISIGFLASSRVEEHKFLEFTEGHKDFYKGKNK